MRKTFAGVLLLIAGCTSLPTTMDAVEGGPGQDISVGIAGVEESMMPIDREGTRAYKVQIEVSNNSNHPVTVTAISVGPASGMSGPFAISRSSSTFNEMIDPGEDHVFDVRLEARLVRPFRQDESRSVEFRVMVSLANGESYFYTFEGPVVGTP